ncbi:hypothetical protein Hanom_Chr00s003508g01712951 [Helianthus anomalus]
MSAYRNSCESSWLYSRNKYCTSKTVICFKEAFANWQLTLFLFFFFFFFKKRCFFLLSCKCRVAENATEQLRPSQGIRQGQVTFGGLIGQLPRELIRKCPVVVLQHFSVQLLHPSHFYEEFGEIFVCFLPQSFLHTVPELIVAVVPPQLVNCFQISFLNKLDFREEDVSAFLCSFAGECNDKAPGFLVGFTEVVGVEQAAEEVERGGGLGGGCGGGERVCFYGGGDGDRLVAGVWLWGK